MLRIAIVEDEREYMEQLKEYLIRYQQESDECFQITTFSDGDEIIENYRSQFDLILIDIEMRFMDGMATARKIRETDEEVIIIFITNMAQYAIQGYEVDALDYVLKPVSYFAFSQRLKRALSRMKNRTTKYLTIHGKTHITKIPIPELYWIESEGHRLTYITSDNRYESTVNTMKEMEGILKEEHFFRCNKCYLVNLAHVKGIEGSNVIVGNQKILISRARKSEFQKVLTNYAGEMIK